MTKFISMILGVAALLVTGAQGQVKGFGFGPRVGISLADYMNSGGKTRAGLYAGAFADYNFTERWGIETGVFYAQTGSVNIMEVGYGKTDQQMDYIVVPLVGKFNFLGGFRLILGVEGMFLTSAHRKMHEEGKRVKMEGVRSTNLTVNGGIGYLFNCGLDISATYSKGFYSARKNMERNTHPTVYRVAVGWRFIGCNR